MNNKYILNLSDIIKDIFTESNNKVILKFLTYDTIFDFLGTNNPSDKELLRIYNERTDKELIYEIIFLPMLQPNSESLKFNVTIRMSGFNSNENYPNPVISTFKSFILTIKYDINNQLILDENLINIIVKNMDEVNNAIIDTVSAVPDTENLYELLEMIQIIQSEDKEEAKLSILTASLSEPYFTVDVRNESQIETTSSQEATNFIYELINKKIKRPTLRDSLENSSYTNKYQTFEVEIAGPNDYKLFEIQSIFDDRMQLHCVIFFNKWNKETAGGTCFRSQTTDTLYQSSLKDFIYDKIKEAIEVFNETNTKGKILINAIPNNKYLMYNMGI